MGLPARLLFFCLTSLLHIVAAFKEHDFKKCEDSGFCGRLRGQIGPRYTVTASSVTVEGNKIAAQLTNTEADKTFQLQVTTFSSIIRVQVLEPGADRYELPDILEAELPAAVDITHKEVGGAGAMFVVADQSFVIKFDPFQLEVPGRVVLNSRDLFHIEHRREKPEDVDDTRSWEESFKGHDDTKPKGPQAMSLDITFPEAVHAYGIPQHATSLSLKPTVGANVTSQPYRLYNLDVFEYLDDSPFGLYGSIPYLTAMSEESSVGVFWLNAAEMYIDISKSEAGVESQWLTESGSFDVFLLLGPSPLDLSKQFASLTGKSAMPQMFSIGYHQCRWNYRDEEDVRAVSQGFDDHLMPCDVIWLDIEHTDGKRYMTWDDTRFPDPISMLDGLSSVGRKMVTIVDPHVKRDEHYDLHKQATKKKYYVRNAAGKDFEGWCWPGSSSYLDVLNPEIREWWSSHFTTASYKGSTGDLYIWNDMNEPSVFNGPEITMPKDALHMGSIEHRDVHNVYGLYYHQATADGLILRGAKEKAPAGDRPFVLSRAFFAGTQRAGPVWTGDNGASWEHLRVSMPMLLSMSIAGLPNVGADVGGFFGNPEVELLQRWYQAAIFYPFFRAHAHIDTKRREPWLFDDAVTNRIRVALRERYALLPYLYTLFRAANETGEPIMRPMFYEYPYESSLLPVDQQLMFGPAILAAPVVHPGATHVDMHLPAGEVFYKSSGERIERPASGVYKYTVTMDEIPRLYRGGYIVPRRERARRSTRAQSRDPFTLLVSLDAQGTAQGRLYLDDGSSFAFLNGEYIDADIQFKLGVLTYTPKHVGVQYSLAFERVIIFGWPFQAPGATYAAKMQPEVEVEVTRAAVFGASDARALVVRNPLTTVSKPWTLEVHEM